MIFVAFVTRFQNILEKNRSKATKIRFCTTCFRNKLKWSRATATLRSRDVCQTIFLWIIIVENDIYNDETFVRFSYFYCAVYNSHLNNIFLFNTYARKKLKYFINQKKSDLLAY